uniref:5' nucleotidase, NT5C type n=1 Tax=Desulfobacca sp. TaxID=2067990 RepID=UPI004049A1C9
MVISKIDPRRLAFDIDGVVADIMSTFMQLAKERYGLHHLRYEDIVDFDLARCLQIDETIIEEILALLLYQPQTLEIAPLPEAVPTLTRLAQEQPLLFVTARDRAEPIAAWLSQQLPAVPSQDLKVIATGAPEAKLFYLKEHNIRYFVEDRLETCFQLARCGIQPLVFDQPWNRRPHTFPIVYSWQDLANLIF